MPQKFTVLAVCTGNICRSPAMERLLAHYLGVEPDIKVISAGTHAHDGEDMQAQMKRRVVDYGADGQDFVAEQVTVELIESSDLIVAATRVHVEDMLTEVPSAQDRLFTLPEFGRLLQGLSTETLAVSSDHNASTAERLAALVPLVNEARGASPTSRSEDEIVDPYMLPDSVFDESFRQIREPVEALAQALNLKS